MSDEITRKRIIVIGGGAAGIIAAWRAASLGAKVLLIEKTPRLGSKILISGGGKCNITHDGDLKEVLRAFRENEAKFIRPSCFRFTNQMIVKMITDRGLEVYTRPDGSIFPVRGTAKDVVVILESYLHEVKVEIRLNNPVSDIIIENNQVGGVFINGREERADAVVLATGGSSYPKIGTTGDGWQWAKKAGHTIAKVHAALAPIYLQLDEPGEPLPPDIRSGIAIRDGILKARNNRKEIARWRGDLLLTHRGVSGPCALGISRIIAELPPDSTPTLEFDFLPDQTFEGLSKSIHSWSSQYPKKQISSYLESIMASRLTFAICKQANISPDSILSRASKKDVNRLIEVLKGWNLGKVRSVPLELGEVVGGGVCLDEVNPHTMASLKCAHLFLCGEVLDIAGPVGGYNLQAAFATGYVAGESSSK